MDRNFGGIIWTNHALVRMKERGVKQSDAWATWRNPEQGRKAHRDGSWIYYKTYGNEKIEVVATQNEKKEWIVLSVWSRPVYERSKTYAQSGGWWDNFLEKLLRTIFGGRGRI